MGHSQLRMISLWDKNIETGHGQLRLFKISFSKDKNVETGQIQLRMRAREAVKEKHQ